MRVPRLESISSAKLSEQEAREVVERLERRQHLAVIHPLHDVRAWERAIPPPVTAVDVKAAFRAVQLATRGVELGADATLLEGRKQDFALALTAWLMS